MKKRLFINLLTCVTVAFAFGLAFALPTATHAGSFAGVKVTIKNHAGTTLNGIRVDLRSDDNDSYSGGGSTRYCDSDHSGAGAFVNLNYSPDKYYARLNGFTTGTTYDYNGSYNNPDGVIYYGDGSGGGMGFGFACSCNPLEIQIHVPAGDYLDRNNNGSRDSIDDVGPVTVTLPYSDYTNGDLTSKTFYINALTNYTLKTAVKTDSGSGYVADTTAVGGKITTSPDGKINCLTTCSATFQDTSGTTVVAAATSGYNFVGFAIHNDSANTYYTTGATDTTSVPGLSLHTGSTHGIGMDVNWTVTAYYKKSGSLSCSFSQASQTINRGQALNLTYSTNLATGASIDNGVGSVSVGSNVTKAISPAPTTSTTYQMTVTSGANSAICSESVTVIAPTLSCSAVPGSGNSPLSALLQISNLTGGAAQPFQFKITQVGNPTPVTLTGITTTTRNYTFQTAGNYTVQAYSAQTGWVDCTTVDTGAGPNTLVVKDSTGGSGIEVTP